MVVQCSSASPWIRSAVTFQQISCTKPKAFQLSELTFVHLNRPHTNNCASAEPASGGVCFPLLTAGRAAGDYNTRSNTILVPKIDDMNLGSENLMMNTAKEQENERIEVAIRPVCKRDLAQQEMSRSPLQGHHHPDLRAKKQPFPTLASRLPMHQFNLWNSSPSPKSGYK